VLRRDLAHRDRFSGIVGNSAAMNGVFRLMESAAASPIAVLIEGETGTGKELVARGIHRASDRAEKAFLALNCAALPVTLLESELFGHSRGAFTGADRDRQGAFEAADGGTIFLDEIGETPLEMQAKLLRVLQEGEVTPVGSHRARKVDVRVVSATNKDLKRSADGGSFRADLYYRVSAFPIRVPPLRERAEDIPLLVEHLLGAAAKRHGKKIAGIERAVVDRIAAFAWPGNVRELENEIERAVALTPPGEPLRLEVLSEKLVGIVARAADGEDRPGEAPRTDGTAEVTPLEDARSQFETRYIREALKQFGGNVSHTAKRLGISRVTLQKKMKEYDLR
jgi:transcriptional regulator with PAS, ATPase and Fis domain